MSVFGIRHSLIIKSVRDSDLGDYFCVAQNGLNESRAQIELSGIEAALDLG